MSNVDELTAPINKLAKQVKLILTKIEDLDKKLEEHLKPTNSEEDKERMDKIFEKKQVGRPVGDFNTKQNQYLNMLNEGKIKQPKPVTLKYYNIQYDEEKKVYEIL